jgi:Family of unknown function (DUF6882)
MQAKTSFLDYARWDFDADDASMTFTDASRPPLRFAVTLVGSLSERTHTWMWSWANEHVDRRLVRDAWRLRHFAEVRGTPALAEGCYEADEVNAWEMTSVAAHLLGAPAVYRAPMGDLKWFMLLDEILH